MSGTRAAYLDTMHAHALAQQRHRPAQQEVVTYGKVNIRPTQRPTQPLNEPITRAAYLDRTRPHTCDLEGLELLVVLHGKKEDGAERKRERGGVRMQELLRDWWLA